jgi:hypothetical protein
MTTPSTLPKVMLNHESDSAEDDAPDDNNPDQAPHILAAFVTLPLFDELFLRMQATNISIVDGLIEPMESDLLRELIELERTPVPSAMAVSAMSQMWIFGVYELLRTWRQRVAALLKIDDDLRSVAHSERRPMLELRASAVRSSQDETSPALGFHRGSLLRLEEPAFAHRLVAAHAVVEPVFRRIESLRIMLAKHEVPKSKLVAVAPGYGRIDYATGAIYWQVDLKDDTVDVINRREIADDLRRLKI